MASRYWVGGSGTWDASSTAHWSSSSGGSNGSSAPTIADDVFFDANSFSGAGQTVTIGSGAICRNMTWSNATNNPTLSGSSDLTIYGDIIFISAMTYSHTGNLYLGGDKNITTNGLSLTPYTISISSNITILDNLTTSGIISIGSTRSLSAGNISIGYKNITCGALTLSAQSVLALGTATITVNGSVTLVPTSSFTGTGTLVMNGVGGYFFGNGGLDTSGNTTVHTIRISNNTTIRASNTFQNIIVDASKILSLRSSCTQTTSSLNLGNNSTIQSDSGSISTNLDYISTNPPTIGSNVTYTRVAITTPNITTRYWVGGTGNTSDSSKWSAFSGFAQSGGVPSASNSIFFDSNSFTSTGLIVTVDSTLNASSITFSGVNNVPTLQGNATLNLYGNCELVSGMNLTYTGDINIKGRCDFTCGGKTLLSNINSTSSTNLTFKDAVILGGTNKTISNFITSTSITMGSTSHIIDGINTIDTLLITSANGVTIDGTNTINVCTITKNAKFIGNNTISTLNILST